MPVFLMSRKPFRQLAESLRVISERHNERHQPSGFGFGFGDRVDYLPALNWMLRGLLGAVPHAEAPERNPFKFAAEGNVCV